MRQSHFGVIDVLLLIACLAVLAPSAWYASSVIRDGLSIEGLQASVGDEAANLRRLRTIDNVSGPQQELAQFHAQLAKSLQPVLPATVDEMQLVYGLLDFIPSSSAKIISLRAQDAKTQNIGAVVFDLVGYEIALEGNPFDMITMVKRIDQNPLASLMIPALTLTKAEQRWNMKAVVVARLPSPSQPAPPPQATPFPTRTPSSPAPQPAQR